MSKIKSAPAHVKSLLVGDASSIELEVKVADSTVAAYGFAFDGAPVPMKGGKGKFLAPPAVEKLLEWTMLGNPGSTMKVTVTRGGTKVKEREKSTIPPPFGEGYDCLKIKVS